MPKPTSTLTPETILAHERLYPRLASLLKQVENVAKQRPAQPVGAESVKLARELCQEAGQLLGKQGRGIGVPRGALDHASLAVALGQAVAGLEAFEGEHAQLSARHQAICWTLPDGKRQPVARLLPRTPPKGATVWDEAEREFSKAHGTPRHPPPHPSRERSLPDRLSRRPRRQAAAQATRRDRDPKLTVPRR